MIFTTDVDLLHLLQSLFSKKIYSTIACLPTHIYFWIIYSQSTLHYSSKHPKYSLTYTVVVRSSGVKLHFKLIE